MGLRKAGVSGGEIHRFTNDDVSFAVYKVNVYTFEVIIITHSWCSVCSVYSV
jgi:hypothetical protein